MSIPKPTSAVACSFEKKAAWISQRLISVYAPYESPIATSPPSRPLIAPCSRKGRRMNPSVAPTSRMIAISRLRCSTAMRIVVPMMMIATTANAAPTTRPTAAATCRSRSSFSTQSRPNRTSSTNPNPRSRPATSLTCWASRDRGPSPRPPRRAHLPQPVQLLHPVAAEPDVVHEPEPAQPVGHLVDVLGVAKPRLELQLDRGRQGVALQLLQHVAELDQLSPRARQRRVLAHVRGRLHFGEGLDVFFCECNGLDRRAGQEVGHDLHALRHAAQGVLQIHRYQPEQADHEQRERDGRHRERGQEGRPAEREQRFADREVHGEAARSRGSSPAESYTSAPSR